MLVCLLLLPLAAMCDGRVAEWVHLHNLKPVMRASRLAFVIKAPGNFWFTLAVGGIILLFALNRWRNVVTLLLGGMLAGLFYTLVKWSVGRTRPFSQNIPPVPPFVLHPFHLGIAGLWKANNQTFPSGHACLAFSTAAALAMTFRKGWVAFYLLATAVGVERVLENAHYPSDVVGGAFFGILATRVTKEFVSRLFPYVPDSLGFSPMCSEGDTVG